MDEHSTSCTFWDNYKEGKKTFRESISSLPYARKNREFPKASFGVTLSAQNALSKVVCQFF